MTEAAGLQSVLDTLRTNGAAERDPIRLIYVEALARRIAAQPEAIRRLLDAKLGATASQLAARPETPPAEMSRDNAASPLAELLAHINQHAHAPSDVVRSTTQTTSIDRDFGHKRQAPELKSVAYFHETWSKLSTEQQLTQTLAQAPENAGPMNAQHLVLRSLQVMRDIAPDYLQGFMSYIDTLIWLEHAAPTKLKGARSSVGKAENRTQSAEGRRTGLTKSEHST